MDTTLDTIDEAAIATFHKDGFIIVRNMVTPAKASEWKDALASHFDHGNSESGVHVMTPEQLPPGVLTCCIDSPISQAATRLIGHPLEFLSAKPVFKSSKVNFPSPWHQDYAYWLGDSPKYSAWIALEPATKENGALRVIPGTHHTFLEHQQEGENFANFLPPETLPLDQAVDAIMDAGDVVIFHDRAIHASWPNTSGRNRWSLIPTWRIAGTTDALGIWDHPIPVATT